MNLIHISRSWHPFRKRHTEHKKQKLTRLVNYRQLKRVRGEKVCTAYYTDGTGIGIMTGYLNNV